jgi:hypothetical protein
MKESILEERKKIPLTVDHQWLVYYKKEIGKRLFGSINTTKALYGDHSINILTEPTFELRDIDDLGLFLCGIIIVETIEEVPA